MIKIIPAFVYYVLVFITPLLMFPGTSEIFEFNKMLFIYLIAASIFFLWFLSSILAKAFIRIRTSLDLPIILFFISLTFSTVFSIDFHTSLFGYYGRFNGGLLSIITYIILFYGFIFLFDFKKIINLLHVSLLSSFLVMLWGLPGKLGFDLSCLVFTGQFNNSCWTDQFRPAERMFSTLGQPNWLGSYIAIHFFIGLYFFMKAIKEKRVPGTLIFMAYLIFNYTVVLYTRSRSSLLAVFAGFLLFLVFFLRTKPIVFLAILFILLTIVFKTGIQKIDHYTSIDTYKKILGTAKDKKTLQKTSSQPQGKITVTTSSDIRKIVWQGAIELGLRYPLFGTGVETFAYSYYFVRPKEHNLTSEWDYLYNKAHNEFLNYFATTGFIGLGTYLLLIGSVLYIAISKIKNQIANSKISYKNSKFKNNNEAMKPRQTWLTQWNNDQLLTFCLLLSYLTILISNFFGFSTTSINIFFFLIPAILLKKDDALHSQMSKSSAKFNTSNVLGIVVGCVIFSFLLLGLVNYFLADTLYAQAENFARVGEYQKSADLLQEALKHKSEHVYEDKLSYSLANLSLFASYQNQKDISQSMKNLSTLYNNKSIRSSPKNVLYWKTKAKNDYLFYQINSDNTDITDGIGALTESRVLSPTDPKIPYSLAIFYSLLFDETDNTGEKEMLKNKSLQEIDESIRLKPDYRDGYFLKAQLLKKYGQSEEAKKVLQFILDTINPNDQEVKNELQK